MMSRIPLRILLALMVGLLVAIALAFAIIEQRDSSAVLQQAERLQARNRPVDVSLELINNFVAERGRSAGGLLMARPIDDELRKFLDERRQAGDEQIGLMLDVVPESSLDKAKAAKQLWERVRAARPELDLALLLPDGQRDPELSVRWLDSANDYVDGLLRLAYDMTDYSSIDDIGLDYLNNLRVASTLFSAMITAESSIFQANSASGRILAPQEFAALRVIRHQSSLVWDRLSQDIQRTDNAEIASAAGGLKTATVDELRALQDEILAASGKNGFVSDGGRVQRYVALSTVLAREAGNLGKKLGQLEGKYIQNRIDKARELVRMAWFGIAVTLFVGALLLALFARRVVQPLQSIQQRIDLLIQKQSEYFSQPAVVASGGGELDRINIALQLLDDAMEVRIRNEEALHEHEELCTSILKSVPQAVIVTDAQGIITMFSPGAEAMLGYSAAELVGIHTPVLFHDEKEIQERARELTDRWGVPVRPDREVFFAKTNVTGSPEVHEWTYVRKDGSRLSVLLSITEVKGAHGIFYGCGVATDITERSQMAAELSRLANYDPLTQLPNRRLFQDRIRMAITQARRDDSSLALMVIDIDRFKPVNDQYGHSVGDLLLKAIAERMQNCLRESDTLARVGGDEFVVILPMIGDSQNAAAVGEKIRQSVCHSFRLLADITVSVDCSIGIAIYPDHGTNEEALLKVADNAMYVAKALGRARVHVADGVREKKSSSANPALTAQDGTASNPARRRGQGGNAEADPDRDHRDLFQQGNAIIRALANGQIAGDRLLKMTDRLIDLAIARFRDEERILANCGYADLKTHGKLYEQLVLRALEMRNLAAIGELPQEDLVKFLTSDIVVEHMLIDNKAYSSAPSQTSDQMSDQTVDA